MGTSVITINSIYLNNSALESQGILWYKRTVGLEVGRDICPHTLVPTARPSPKHMQHLFRNDANVA